MGRGKHQQQDRNFDGLAQRFQRNIYNTMKGQLRLAVLRRDFDEYLAGSGLDVLDVGAGQGHWALELLRKGHKVTLVDVSAEMLRVAEANITNSDLPEAFKANATYCQCALQRLPEKLHTRFDLIVCHALMEWLEQPNSLFQHLRPFFHGQTLFSVIFYNRNGLIFKNMLRTNYTKVLAQDFCGAKGSLTPLNPLTAQEVLAWAESEGWSSICHSGIRVFHDYILDPQERKKNTVEATELELQYSRLLPFRDLGRYIHLLLGRAVGYDEI